jgi:arylsulfatase A-like enzyme
MTAAEAAHPRGAVRAGGLAAILLVAKALALANRGVTLTATTGLAYVWQDVAVALAFWLIDKLSRRSPWLWAPYAVISVYVVVNVAVVATLGSPLTPTMLRATGGAIGDSMRSALTPSVLMMMGGVLAIAAIAPWLLGRVPRAARRISVAIAIVITIAGAWVARSVDSAGLDRNAISALLMGSVPRIGATTDASDFRVSPFEQRQSDDLARYRGAAKRLNVLLVALESTAARYLASYGAKDDPTPALTALARESILFEAAYAAYPESVKGLFAVLCASPPAFGVPAETLAQAACDSIVHRLSTAGYRTGLFHAGRFSYLGMQAVVDAQRFEVADDAGSISGQRQSSFGVDEPAVVERILSWIDRGPSDRPFFATYLPAAGHHPYHSTAAGPFSPDTALGAYKNAIHEGDRALGSLLAGLRTRGLLDRTLVVVFGDHGEAFDQHPGNRVHSLYIYDENVRVPLVVRVPVATALSAGQRIRRVASVIDIGPTILDLLGQPTEAVEGASLLQPRERMALFHADYDRGWLGLRDACWKFMFELETRRSRLFDVCADPDETRDLAGQEPARIRAYGTRVEEWAAARRAAVLGVRR